MSQFKFIYQYDDGSPQVTVDVPIDSNIEKVIEAFEMFLRCSGFSMDGEIVYQDIPEENKRMGCNHSGKICEA